MLPLGSISPLKSLILRVDRNKKNILISSLDEFLIMLNGYIAFRIGFSSHKCHRIDNILIMEKKEGVIKCELKHNTYDLTDVYTILQNGI